MNNPILILLRSQKDSLDSIIGQTIRLSQGPVTHEDLAKWQQDSAFLIRQLAVCFREFNEDFTKMLMEKDVKDD